MVCVNGKISNNINPCCLTLRFKNERSGAIKLYSIAHYKGKRLVLNNDFQNLRIKKNKIVVSTKMLVRIARNSKVVPLEGKIKKEEAVFRNLRPGTYLVVQEKKPKRYYTIKPFIIYLPQIDENGRYKYNVIGSPKVEHINNQQFSNYNKDDKSKDGEIKNNRQNVKTVQTVETDDKTKVIFLKIMIFISCLIMFFSLKVFKKIF